MGGPTAPGASDEPAEVVALEDLGASTTDDVARARSRRIARRLSLRPPTAEDRHTGVAGELVSARWHGAGDDLDLDATLEVLAAHPLPEDEDLVVRERQRTARTVVLVVDLSGSMTGERALTAAATVGALAGELGRDRLAVVAFWSDAAVLVRPGERVAPLALLDLLLRVPTRGLTNVTFALTTAAQLVADAGSGDARVLLLSDAVHNAGPDPRGIAARLPRLDVLLDVSGERDVELGRDLARAGRGRCRLVHDHRDVAPALSAIFAR
ncbi:vWA domain-containing protein [Actinomycetospora aeridis]|uniref:VWA domain-containing protein n=1 Tax=Actinomycetospora aeridis TaxID=3129231 RepID=A0ABU8N8Y8_9PSEU